MGETLNNLVQTAFGTQPSHRDSRLGPHISYLKEPWATKASRQYWAQARDRQRGRRDEHDVGTGQRHCPNACSRCKTDVVGSSGGTGAMDSTRSPDPVVSNAVDRLGG